MLESDMSGVCTTCPCLGGCPQKEPAKAFLFYAGCIVSYNTEYRNFTLARYGFCISMPAACSSVASVRYSGSSRKVDRDRQGNGEGQNQRAIDQPLPGLEGGSQIGGGQI